MLIQRMRDGSEGVLAKVIIGLILIVFALFGFGSITTFLAPTPKVATVNGKEIPQQDMEIAVERNRRMMLAQDVALQDIDEDELRQNVLQNLVTRELLAQASDEFGLHYSDASIDQEIIEQEVFHIDGVFSPEQFKRAIAGAGYSPLSYRDEVRTDKKFEQMLSGITRTAFLTKEEAGRYASLLSQTRDVAYLQLEAASLVDEVEVSDEELSSYYKEHLQDFVTEETVKLQYIELKHSDLAASLNVTDSDLEQYLAANIGLYSTDESRRVAHILVEAGGEVSDDEAKAEAEAIYERIKNGEDYAELARSESDDIGSRENGGDLGFNEQGTFATEFEAAAYDLGLNQVSPPVKTDFGYHIIKVLEIDEAVVPGLEDVRQEVEKAYRDAESEEEFVSMSTLMAELLFESEDLAVPAEELGLEIKTTGALSRTSENELMSQNLVREAAFSPDVLIDGNNSDLIRLADDRVLGLRVVEHKPSENKSLETVQEDIRYIIQRRKARELGQERAKAIVAKIQGGSLGQFVADEYNLEWQLVPGTSRRNPEVDPFILNEAFALPRPGSRKETIGWSTMPNGDSVVLRISKVEAKPVEELAEGEADGIKRVLSGQMGALDFQEFRNSLRRDADIEGVNLSVR